MSRRIDHMLRRQITAARPSARPMAALAAILATAGALRAASVIGVPAQTVSGTWEVPSPILVLGLIVGLTYGLLAAGLILVYRTSQIINFAHGNIGAFAAAVMGVLVVRWGLPYWLALPLALAVGGAVAAATDVLVIRRLRDAPRLMSIVATLGVGQFVVLLGFAVNSQAGTGSIYPQPPGMPDFMLGGLRVSPAFSGMLLLSPLLLLALGTFLNRTRFGIGIRSSSDNPAAARLAGIFSTRMSALAWALSGMLAAFTAILTQPTRGFTTAESFGPGLLLMALAAATVGRMSSIPAAVAGGVALGVVEQLLSWNHPGSGAVEVVLFVIILLGLLVQRVRTGRDEDATSWASVQAVPPLPEALRELWLMRNLGRVMGAGAVAIALLLPLFLSASHTVIMTVIFAYAMVALSLGVITGLGGQLTLGQFAFAAVGAFVSYEVSRRTGLFPVAFLMAGFAAGAAAVLVGLPALRLRGLLATVTTLAFALSVPAALGVTWLFGTGVDPGRPVLFGQPLDTSREYYFVALAGLLVAVVLVANIRRSGLARLMIAVRDNEDAARSFTISATGTKLRGFLLGGFIAGLGGAVYVHALSNVGGSTFPVSASIDIAKMTVIGGISTLAGPLLGALFVIGLPAFLPLDAAGLAATSFGQLLILMYLPRGLMQVVVPVRDRLARALGRRAGLDVDAAFQSRDGSPTTSDGLPPKAHTRPSRDGTSSSRVTRAAPGTVPLLRVRDVAKSFGGVRAVDGVSFDVCNGEVVGLIGPNGAGKTTTFEVISGFTSPDRGSVEFDGDVITHMPAEHRARFGLVRSFQDAALFPTMSVQECVMLAMERRSPTRMLASLAGRPGAERAKQRAARELVGDMGLWRYRDKPIMQLSTGTRRITELACLVALEPRVLLLDEPSSGIAQRESEALGGLLLDLRDAFGMSLVVIEHDIPLVMSISDRIVAMADGGVLCEGPPQDVRTDPRVIDAYMGASATAIERSDTTLEPAP